MGWFKTNFKPVDIEDQRVRGELEQARLWLEEAKGSSEDQTGEVSTRTKLLDDASQAIDNDKLFKAWGYLLAFNRKMVMDMYGSELDARIISARAEAKKKLPGWRGDAVIKLLDFEGNVSEAEKQRKLRESLFHLHSKSQNTYFKIGKAKNQIFAAMCLLVVTTFSLIILSPWIMEFDYFKPVTLVQLQLAMIAGFVGGVLSVAFSVSRTDPKQEIPQLQASIPATWIRTLFGPLMAFALLIIFQLGFIDFGIHKVQSLIGMSFLAGFSERWFLNLVGKVQEKAGGG